jgi:hypothetical protein
VWRLRDDSITNSITIVHAVNDGEGELALAIAAARIARNGVKVLGPEPSTVFALVEHGLHIGAKVIFGGELRRIDDARALRGAAALGTKAVGIITQRNYGDAQNMLRALGPWTNYDVGFFSIAGGCA